MHPRDMDRVTLMKRLDDAKRFMLRIETLGNRAQALVGAAKEKEASYHGELAAMAAQRKKWLIIGGVLGLLFSLQTYGIGLILGIGLPLFLFSRKKSAIEDTWQAQQAEIRRDNDVIRDLNEQADALLRSPDAQVLEGLPEEYCNSYSLGFLHNQIMSARADTLGQAINNYDTQLHRWKMEASQAEMLAAAQRTAAMQEAIEQSARQAAVAASISAVTGVVGLFRTQNVRVVN